MEITHRSRENVIHGLLRFMPSESKDDVINIASAFMKEEGGSGRIERLEIVSCGTRQWGISFCYLYSGRREEYQWFVQLLTREFMPRFADHFHWSITSDVIVIERKK